MFRNRKQEEAEEKEKAKEKAQQEQVSQAMRSMSDQLAAKGKEIADLEKQLEAVKKEAASGDAAEKALAEAQTKMREMQAEMAKLQIQAQSAQHKAKQAAEQAAEAAAKVDAKPAPEAVLGGAPTAPASGMLGVGVSAWVRNAGGKNLRLRDKPGLQSNAFAGLPPGTQMTILEGPVQDDGYPWWRVRVSDGREGWVAGTELVTQPE